MISDLEEKVKPTVASLKILMNEINNRQSIIEETTIKAGIHEIEAEMASLQARLEEKRFQSGIVSLESELSGLQAEYATTLQEVGQGITTWQTDQFSKGRKDLYVADGLKILRSSRTVREIRAADFFETFPFLASKIAKCTLKDAEKFVSGADLEKFCDKKVTYSYEVA